MDRPSELSGSIDGCDKHKASPYALFYQLPFVADAVEIFPLLVTINEARPIFHVNLLALRASKSGPEPIFSIFSVFSVLAHFEAVIGLPSGFRKSDLDLTYRSHPTY